MARLTKIFFEDFGGPPMLTEEIWRDSPAGRSAIVFILLQLVTSQVMMMKQIPIFSAILVVALVSSAFAEKPTKNITLEQRIDGYLTYGGASADHLGPDFETELVRDLSSMPTEADNLLRRRIVPVAEYIQLTPFEQRENLNALYLYALCCEKGRSLAADQLRAAIKNYPLDQSIQTGWGLTEEGKKREMSRRAIDYLRRSILSVLGLKGDVRILPEALVLMSGADKATQNDTVRYYLMPVLSTNADALNHVKAAVADNTSNVFKNETLLNVIQEIERPRAKEEYLRLTIESDKKVYRISEPIWIASKIKNISKGKITIFTRELTTQYMLGEGLVDVINSKNKRLCRGFEEQRPSWSAKKSEFLTLEPGQTKIFKFDLLVFSSCREKLQPDTYTVTQYYFDADSYYEDGVEKKVEFPWRGNLKSNTITITIE